MAIIPVCYLISFDDWTIFHPGDAVPYDGMVENLLTYAKGRPIDVALMPINGRLLERRVTGNFWGRESAAFAKVIGARIVIPMHHERFTFKTETPEEFVMSCERLEQPYKVLQGGARLTVSYQPGAYVHFMIHDPKRRLVSAAPFRDRVVHHALCNVIEPFFEQQFIADSYANRVGKGTHQAIDRLQHFAQQYRYVLRCDIVKHSP